MKASEIQDIWKAIRESERSDEIQLRADKILIKAEAARVPHPLQDLFSDMGVGSSRKSIANAAISPALSAPD